MNKSINELGAENVLGTQSQDEQNQPESVSENEESDSVTDQSSSSSSETTNTQNSLSNATCSRRKSNTASTKSSSTVTQFSVQRSDVDGLRMKISAIRPTNISKSLSNTKKPTHTAVAISNTDSSGDICDRTKTQKIAYTERVHFNNNTITKPLTVKLSNIKLQQQNLQPLKITLESKEHQTYKSGANKMSVDTAQQNNCNNSGESGDIFGAIENASGTEVNRAAFTCTVQPTSTAPSIGLPLANLLPQAPCLSDATAESGCSEATTTTIAAGTDKSLTRRVRVKRKKAQTKVLTNLKKPAISAAATVIKSTQANHQHSSNTYSSDSDNDVPIYKQKQQQQLQKRAPRLLLTAINTTPNNAPQIKPLACSNNSALAAGPATFSHGSDNSDNELKLDDVVNAAIKRVESDGDDTPTGGRTRTKRLPQYQSTLLQDFMEKTQMLGSSSTAATVDRKDLDINKSLIRNKSTTDAVANIYSVNPQTDSLPASGKKKRGRPKKLPTTNTEPLNKIPFGAATSVIMSTSATKVAAVSAIAANINESADSGVISTTSTTTTQSCTSPSPKLTSAMISSNISTTRLTATTPSQKRRNRILEASDKSRQPSVSPCKSQTQDGSGSCSANSPKPKIDIAYLDKRMYAATERVLYPPPRNKRRQSLSASSVNLANTPSSKNTVKATATLISSSSVGNSLAPTTAKNVSKEELQLDPVWRKIDVNKKFRRPSVSGYKSDGGGGNTTICSKILAAKSGYVSDYGSFHARAPRDHSGYKSDASGKSRYSMKSCASRRSRAKSCGYRSDCKEGKDGACLKASKYRRKRRSALLRAHSKSVGNLATSLNDVEKDLLQLAGLSLGQSSEESNEYVCKPNLESLPTTSASKKYGEINRFIATGEYFGRGSSSSALTSGGNIFAGGLHENVEGSGSQDGYGFSRKLLLQRKHSSGIASGGAHELLPQPHAVRKIKSRRSSVASYCSSYYSSTSKVRRRRRRKSFLRYPSSNKSGAVIDSKLLTEIDILVNTFSARCRIQSGALEKSNVSNSNNKDKVLVETSGKLQPGNTTAPAAGSGRREQRDKRSLKKRKMSENQEYAVLAGGAGGGSNISGFGGASVLGGGSGGGGGAKRRHKKANNSSSPDDHKLPLKKRHYLLTPGEKSTEAAAAVAAKLFGSTAVEAWAAAVASTKLASAGKSQHSQQQFGTICGSSATLSLTGSTHSGSTKSSKAGLTPKKRQFLQLEEGRESVGIPTKSSSHHSNSSPLRITIDNTLSHKILDISPISMAGSTKQSEVVHRKRSRLEVLVSKIVATSNSGQGNPDEKESPTVVLNKQKQSASGMNLNQHQLVETPPPGVFEPSVALEIQIPPIVKLNEGSSGVSSIPSIVTKAEVNSPLMTQELTTPTIPVSTTAAKTESTSARVVETLLNKTGAANLLLKRKRKKINRTGFPNVRRRKKRKINEQLLLDIVEDEVERTLPLKRQPKGVLPKQTLPTQPPCDAVNLTDNVNTASKLQTAGMSTPEKQCDRVPISGEASDSFLERANRTPRLSVVALERLRGTPTPSSSAAAPTASVAAEATPEVTEEHKENSFVPRKSRAGRKPKIPNEHAISAAVGAAVNTSTDGTENTESTCRKSRVIQTAVPQTTDTEAPIVNTMSNSVTTKSNKRTKGVEKNVVQAAKALAVEKVQPLVATNNSMPRARGRKPKLSAAAILPTTVTQSALFAPDNQRKKPKVEPPPSGKQASSSITKHARKTATTCKTSDHPASFSKSTVHKIITAKSLEAKVKLPAGIDPNTNFSCKIRLKRPSTAQTALVSALRQSMDSNCDGSIIKDIPQYTPEEIAVESAAKDSSVNYLEQDILPRSETPFIDSEAATSDTSDEKCSTSTNVTSTSSVSATSVRKVARLKKNYLPAGLFSDYFKQLHVPLSTKKSTDRKELLSASTALAISEVSNTSTTESVANNGVPNTPVTPALLPPPYCEQYFRRTQIDFQLPYDIWWAYTNSKLPTRITVPSWNYRKIRTNIYADAVRPNTAGIDHPTCNCKPDQGCGDNCLNRMVYTECSPSSCPSREKCRNQKIQRHEVAPGVERFMTTDKGWGVRAKVSIAKGTYILEYVGEVVTEREFKDRMGTIYLNDIHHYCLHLDGGLVIDGHRMGSDGRFVNHSCQPNCEMQKWSVNGLSRMALFAKRNIEPGEELSYDYNFSLFNPSEGQPCRCNTPQCRGVIGGKSQRIKPLPIEAKNTDPTAKDARNGRQRKRKARKNTERVPSKDVVVALVQQLSEREKKLVKQHGIFLVRNFEKIRRCKARRTAKVTSELKLNGLANMSPSSPMNSSSAAAITNRRPSTPASLAAQISALRSPRSIKTRGLTHAVQDPEVEKMAKIAVLLRDICTSLETLKDPADQKQYVAVLTLTQSTSAPNPTDVGNDGDEGDANASDSNATAALKKKKTAKALQKSDVPDLKTVQSNIEQGYYKQPAEFNADMQKVFEAAQLHVVKGTRNETALQELIKAYERKKEESYERLLEIVGGDESMLRGFCEQPKITADEKEKMFESIITIAPNHVANDINTSVITPTCNEDIIRCICGLYKDEGLMIQCARCMVWQHTECTKADIDADNYLCERCEPRIVDREIPLDDFTEEGHRYYLTLMRGELHVRQGDAVYVLRDIPIKDAAGNVVPKQKHTYETIGTIDYNECDIFRVERLWKNEEGKRFIFGHHFLRPHETFHEPSRRFYPNEVVRVPLYEIVPIELVIGRCWVLDRTTFCKGRPVECTDETHCYICELRVDKTARFFTKAKVNYPTCTKSYAFRKFPEKLKISKSYAPHDVDPALLKSKRQKTENEPISNARSSANRSVTPSASSACVTDVSSNAGRQTPNKTPQNSVRKRQNNSSPAIVHLISPLPQSVQTIKQKRNRLETVLKAMKLKWKNTQTVSEQPIDLSYLLSGRGARQRKSQATAVAAIVSNTPALTTSTNPITNTSSVTTNEST